MAHRKVGLGLAAVFFWALVEANASAAVTVVLVRHAEKAAAPAADPPLTAEGKKRAQALADTLQNAGVTAIYATEYLRTQQTAEPLATLVKLTPTRIDGKKSADLVQAIRQHKDGVVLVVGHSNTVPEVIASLGGPKFTMEDSDYDSLFVLTLSGPDVSFLRLHFGDASKAGVKQDGPMLAPIKK